MRRPLGAESLARLRKIGKDIPTQKRSAEVLAEDGVEDEALETARKQLRVPDPEATQQPCTFLLSSDTETERGGCLENKKRGLHSYLFGTGDPWVTVSGSSERKFLYCSAYRASLQTSQLSPRGYSVRVSQTSLVTSFVLYPLIFLEMFRGTAVWEI